MKSFSSTISMQVVKRDGRHVEVSFDKVLQRITKASKGLTVNPAAVAREVLGQIYDGVKTTELDEFTATLSANLSTEHPDYATLAANITISNHQKNTIASFKEVIKVLSNQVMPKTGEHVSYVSDELVEITEKHGDAIDEYLVHDRDYLIDYFGFKTLEKSYLLKDANGKLVERPQHLWMRVSLALWGSVDINKAFETYDLMSQKYFTHATPTLFNAGTRLQQLSSCFLLSMDDDSISGIYKTLGDCAQISKNAGGIGLHCHNIRAKGSLIRGTNGKSNGLVPMLRVFNNTARYVDQCFTPDTLIFTQSGPKMIEDVGISDKVLTSTGEYKNVRVPVRHEFKGTMLDIQIKQGVYPVRVTGEHQILALRNQDKGLNYDIIRNRLSKKLAAPEFTDAKDLVPNDFLVFPIPTYVEDISVLSEEDCRFYGILLGDGYISAKTSGVSLNENSKKDTFEFVVEYLTKRGITHNTDKNEEGTSSRIRWTTTNPGFKFTRKQLYIEKDGQLTKNIDSSFLHLPENKTIQLVRGIIETDGCVGSKEVVLELSSYPLIEAVRYLILRLGGLCSGYERNRVGNVSSTRDITTRLPTAVLRIPRLESLTKFFPNAPKSEWFNFLNYNGNIYTRIQTITEVEYDGVVHDFEIEDPHDYTVAHLGIAHNGGGRRNGSFAMYLEPWHADVEEFLRLKLNTGAEEDRARDLFYALWVPDLFMERVEANADWSLFCPNEAPGLSDVVGDEFKALYEKYEREGRARKTVPSQKLWFQILDTQMETGTPYLCYKDASNKKSNQQNVGVIKSSNLCTEIIEYSDKHESAVCNLASIGLPAFVNTQTNTFDFDELRRVTKIVAKNLNRVIDINYYPTPETRRSNMRHRPIGLGVQGLADVFALMKLSWDDAKAADLNQRIFEHMYYASVEASHETAQEDGPYESFDGSPISKGILQPDLWNVTPLTVNELDWNLLREKAKLGVRNSLLLAPMPTASTSQILGYNECFEPFNSNLYTRRTLAGEFIVINKYLLKELVDAKLWNQDMKQQLILRNGSVVGIDAIPLDIQERYRTVYEMKQKTIIDMAAARGAFICQSQSLNLFVADPTYAKLTSMHFYAWKQGLKTGCYYLRTKAPVMAQKFTVDPRLFAGSNAHIPDEDSDSDSDNDSCGDSAASDVEEDTPEQKKLKERAALKERLAKEYLEESQKAADEGCLMCSG